MAFGSNGEILVYAGSCLGLKADISVELDIALGFWNRTDIMLGTIYQLGLGADTAELKNEPGNDETGAHVEQMYNSDGEFIGGEATRVSQCCRNLYHSFAHLLFFTFCLNYLLISE